jgi:hypothetical protein
MKKSSLLTVLFMSLCLSGWAQTSRPIRVKAGENIMTAIPFADRYRHPAFLPGSITYTSGTTSKALLNYNLLLGEVQFIGPKGDTMSLANEQFLRHIAIGETSYHFDQQAGYLEIRAEHHPLKLAVKHILVVGGNDKVGAYEQSTGASSIKNYSSYSTGNTQIQQLTVKGDVVFSGQTTYHLLDQNNRSYLANKGSILKLFPKHKKAIEQFMKEEALDVRQEDDLRKLLQFCQQLS